MTPGWSKRVVDEVETLEAGVITQDGVARVFVQRYASTLRFCHHTDAWFVWTGTYWRRDETKLAFHFCRLLGREVTQLSTKSETKEVRKIAFAGGVEKFARTDVEIAVTSADWDQDPYLLGTPGGTVDLRTGKLRDADPADGITKITAVTPAETADCPRWIKFLNETFSGAQDTIRFVQQWCGYCLTGDVLEHALVFGCGNGGNGKGTLLDTVTGIMQDYAVTAPMETFVATKWSAHPTELAMLRGARMVTASETEEGRSWAEARIKQITGGDRISARFMHKDFFTYMPSFKLTIIGNHKPVLHSIDDAIKRRFNLLPFLFKPAKPDLLLGQTLRGEWPGILRWMIDGCLDWQKHRLIRPKAVTEATTTYFKDQDLIGQWLEECCEIAIGNRRIWTSSSQLFASWSEFARRAGESAGSSKAFATELARRGFEKGEQGDANVKVRYGIRLKGALRIVAGTDVDDDTKKG
jgi:putative DNA primase/helicase